MKPVHFYPKLRDAVFIGLDDLFILPVEQLADVGRQKKRRRQHAITGQQHGEHGVKNSWMDASACGAGTAHRTHVGRTKAGLPEHANTSTTPTTKNRDYDAAWLTKAMSAPCRRCKPPPLQASSEHVP